jgi:steroid delta-isomerase-like uncharacterized protein
MCSREEGYPMNETTESIIRQDVEEVWNSGGNLDIIDDIFAEDFVFYSPMGSAEIHGPDGYREFAEQFHAAFSNMITEIEDTTTHGERAAGRFIMHATHDGEFMGIEPTNQDVELIGMIVEHIEDGKIEAKYVNDNRLEFFTQLGAIDPPERLLSH